MENGVRRVWVNRTVGVTRRIMIASGPPKRRRFSDSFASGSPPAFADDHTLKREVCPELPEEGKSLLISPGLSPRSCLRMNERVSIDREFKARGWNIASLRFGRVFSAQPSCATTIA